MIWKTVSDRALLILLRTGKKNGARPFLRNPHGMIEARREAEYRGLIPMSQESALDLRKVLVAFDEAAE